jgi:FixJ family two-component response regulator
LKHVEAPRPLIAIVDDEESVRRALKRLLLSAGFRAVAFASGAEFLASLQTNSPSCVVLDLHMPGLSGFDVQSRIKSAGHAVSVVIITGHDTPESQQRVLAAGATAYLRKPVDDQVLLDAVTAAVPNGKSSSANGNNNSH